MSYVALGVGTVAASAIGYRVARRLGPGPTLVLGFAVCAAGWLLLAVAPLNRLGVAAYALMLLTYGVGAVFIFINFLSLRQSVTPGPMLGRMTSTMRWLILLPAGPGALLGGWLGEQFGLRVGARIRRHHGALARRRRRAARSDPQRQDVAHAQSGGHYALFIGARTAEPQTSGRRRLRRRGSRGVAAPRVAGHWAAGGARAVRNDIRVGLIADTHGLLRPEAREFLQRPTTSCTRAISATARSSMNCARSAA